MSPSPISLVLWHFTLDENGEENSVENDFAQQMPSSSSSSSRNQTILPSGFHLRLHGISTTDGSPMALTVVSVLGQRTLGVADKRGRLKKCTLVGQLNRNETLKAGFSSDLAAEFQQGFPQKHWQQLLHRHVELILARRKKSAAVSTDDGISLVCWRFTFKSIEQPGMFWDFGIFLYGIRADTGDQWESSSITEVLASDLLRTETRLYRLVGQINRKVSIQSGLPVEMVNAFKNGFPDNWRELVEQCVDYMKRMFVKQVLENLPDEEWNEAEGNLENQPIIEMDETSQSSILPSSSSASQQHTPASAKQSNSTLFAGKESTQPIEEARKTPLTKRKKKRAEPLREETAPIVVAVPMPIKVSLSGRLLKPRLNTWTGERIIYDTHGNIIETRCATTRHIAENESPRVMAIASHYDAKKVKVKLSRQVTERPVMPVEKHRETTKKRNRGRNRARSVSVDSYTARLDAQIAEAKVAMKEKEEINNKQPKEEKKLAERKETTRGRAPRESRFGAPPTKATIQHKQQPPALKKQRNAGKK